MPQQHTRVHMRQTKQEKAQQPETQQVPPPPYAPAHTRYITVDADGNVVEERDEP